MSFCINPHCSKPQNSDNILFCQACGSELLMEGRYRVMRQLGGGGFGITYEVSEVRNNTPKVLKVLVNPHPKAEELFKREAEVLAFLNHPGIPKVEPDGYFVYFPRDSREPLHCLVMEKIEGLDLYEYMKGRDYRPINQKLAVQWLTEIVTILQQVHSQNFFHRDIKPPNIMLRADGRLALIDFGTARAITQTYWFAQAQGGVTGINSAGYTPTEQMNGRAVPQSDFFALGRTFVYLLTGKEPTDPAVYDYHTNELRWRDFAPNISPQLTNLIDQMMARFPNQRPANTQEILQRLATIDSGLGPTPNPQPIPPNPYPQPQPQPVAILKYASFWQRFVADLIDKIILIFSSAFIALTSAISETDSTIDQDIAIGTFIICYFILAGVYGSLMECSNSQATLGKMAMGIIVTDLNGNRISFGKAFVRQISKLLSYLSIGVGYIMAGMTDKRQTLHDKVAGCLVLNKR